MARKKIEKILLPVDGLLRGDYSYSEEEPVAVSFAIGGGTKLQLITPEMEGVELEEALKAIDAWINKRLSYMKLVKSLVGPILVLGKYSMYHVVLIKRPETGLYQAAAEKGLVLEWAPDSPDLPKNMLDNIEVREEPIPEIVKLPIGKTEDLVYSCINDKNKGLDYCIEKVSEVMNTVEKTPYHMAVKNDFTNKVEINAKRVIRFHKRESKKYDVKAIYFEMSTLESSPTTVHMFSYPVDGGLDDIEWLASYKGEIGLEFLTGFGRLRNVFEREDPTTSESYEDLHHAAELLVTLKFHRFIRKTAKSTGIDNLSVYAAMHESDLIAKVK